MMQQATLDVLRHINVHGGRTRAEVLKAFPNADGTLSNLNYLGFIAGDGLSKPINYIVTKKGKARCETTTPGLPPRAPRQPRRDLLGPQLRALPPMRKPTERNPRNYYPTEFAPSTRPGAMKAFDMPSRMGNRLHWRDGRITDLQGNEITPA